MISKALQFTGDILGMYLKNRMGLDENKVQLNNLIENNGNVPAGNQNKVVISLINIEKETIRPFYNHSSKLKDGNYAEVNPGQRFNLDLLVSSNFDDYKETLKFLDEVILFFQSNPSVDASSFSNIPPPIQKLEYETERINYHDMQSLWTAMGAKYRPSLVYRMRLVSVQMDEAYGYVPAIKSIANKVTNE